MIGYQEITEFFNYGIFFYAMIIMIFYVVLAAISMIAMREYRKTEHNIYFDDILRSPIAPSIAVIAPAYNESLSIVDNIRSLLSLHYNNYEIIIVNDGSKDDTMEKVIAAYDLQVVNDFIRANVSHQPLRNV